MARTLKQLDTFANALKARLDAHDKLHAANPLHSHGTTPPVDPPPVDPPPPPPPSPPPVDPPPPPVDPPPPPPVEPPPPSSLPVVHGFGSKWSEGMGSVPALTVVTSTAEFLAAFAAISTAPKIIRFGLGLKLSIDLGGKVRRLDGRANFLIDGRGADITLTNGTLWFEGCHHFALVNVRVRSKWSGGQSADGITFAGSCHDYAAVNVSTSDAADEGMSSTRSCWNYTYQDCLWGPGQSGHNYGSLNDYQTDRGSHIRPTFVGLEYRCPKIGFWGDSNTSGVTRVNITADVVNRVCVDCDYGLTAHSGALVNDTNPYNQNVGDPVDGPAHGAVIGGQAVPGWAAVPAMSADAAARYAKANAGALPHDAFDTALLGRITA